MNLNLAYYGDDFTGSTDVMEALVRGGVPTVLFVEPPSPEMLDRYPGVRAIGVAGRSRTMSPDQMDALLPDAFAALGRLGPQFVHYKASSTFDSSPQIGSIGRAIDIGGRVFQNRVTPVLAAAPALGRYCAFANLFARSGLGTPPYRLDRHPTMSRHPVTPMDEADLRILLSRQTSRPIELVDALTLEQDPGAAERCLAELPDGSVALFDALTDQHIAAIGRAVGSLQRELENKPLFVVGSSGVDWALVAEWRARGAIPGVELKAPRPVDRILVVSGSCSPVTARQIAWAEPRGFSVIGLDAARLLRTETLDSDVAAIAKCVAAEHDRARSVIVHTSRGASDAETARLLAARSGLQATLGGILGQVVRAVARSCRIERVAVAGGDTAGDAARTLEIESLEMTAPLAPGAPLCCARSRNPDIDGVEFTFKGGQVGYDDFFGAVLAGRSLQ